MIQHINQFRLSYTVINDSKIPRACNNKVYSCFSICPLCGSSCSFAPHIHVKTRWWSSFTVWDISEVLWKRDHTGTIQWFFLKLSLGNGACHFYSHFSSRTVASLPLTGWVAHNPATGQSSKYLEDYKILWRKRFLAERKEYYRH